MSLGVLAGCASSVSTGHPNAYEQMSKACQDRGGFLRAIPGANSINESANYTCELRENQPKGPDRND